MHKIYEELKMALLKEMAKVNKNYKVSTTKENSISILDEDNDKTMMEINLHNLAIRIKNGEKCEDVVKQMIRIIDSNLMDVHDTLKTFNKIKKDIYPLIRPTHTLKNMLEHDKQKVICKKDILPELSLVYVYEQDDRMIFILDSYLEEWNKTIDEIHEIALTNLRATREHVNYVENPYGTKTFFTVETLDAYDASRILTLDFKKYTKDFKGDILVAIPSRDKMFVFDDALPVSLSLTINSYIKNEFEHNAYPVSPKLYIIKDNKISQLL